MSVYDEHPQAVSGPDAFRKAIDSYRAQGIDVVAWFVPKGWDIETQLIMAGQVLESGVTALYADIEPFPGFCDLDCPFLASQFWPRLRERYPTADLGVIYDPRPVNWGRSGLVDWMRPANTVLPMCYWSSFVDQPPWNDPAGCVRQGACRSRILLPELRCNTCRCSRGMLQPTRSGARFSRQLKPGRRGRASGAGESFQQTPGPQLPPIASRSMRGWHLRPTPACSHTCVLGAAPASAKPPREPTLDP
jgi:hypothetical protein